MKPFTTLFIIAFHCLTFSAKSQRFSLSVSAAPQYTFIRNETDKTTPAFDKRSTVNMRFGIGGGYHFSKNIGIAADVCYSWQGQHYQLSGQMRDQQINYLKVPLVFVYNTDPTRFMSFVTKAGPQVSFLTGSKLQDGNDQDIIADTDYRYSNVTLGAVLHAGTQFRLSSRWYLESTLWFDNDFTNAENEEYTSFPVSRANSYNMTTGLQIRLKYFFKR